MKAGKTNIEVGTRIITTENWDYKNVTGEISHPFGQFGGDKHGAIAGIRLDKKFHKTFGTIGNLLEGDFEVINESQGNLPMEKLTRPCKHCGKPIYYQTKNAMEFTDKINDHIHEECREEMNCLALYRKNKFSELNKDRIENAIETGTLDTDDIFRDWQKWAYDNYKQILNCNETIYQAFIAFKEQYQNMLTHPQNWKRFKKFKKYYRKLHSIT